MHKKRHLQVSFSSKGIFLNVCSKITIWGHKYRYFCGWLEQIIVWWVRERNKYSNNTLRKCYQSRLDWKKTMNEMLYEYNSLKKQPWVICLCSCSINLVIQFRLLSVITSIFTSIRCLVSPGFHFQKGFSLQLNLKDQQASWWLDMLIITYSINMSRHVMLIMAGQHWEEAVF